MQRQPGLAALAGDEQRAGQADDRVRLGPLQRLGQRLGRGGDDADAVSRQIARRDRGQLRRIGRTGMAGVGQQRPLAPGSSSAKMPAASLSLETPTTKCRGRPGK